MNDVKTHNKTISVLRMPNKEAEMTMQFKQGHSSKAETSTPRDDYAFALRDDHEHMELEVDEIVNQASNVLEWYVHIYIVQVCSGCCYVEYPLQDARCCMRRVMRCRSWPVRRAMCFAKSVCATLWPPT
jgi:CYTH domain-containing protein